jgi:hypothetical protein
MKEGKKNKKRREEKDCGVTFSDCSSINSIHNKAENEQEGVEGSRPSSSRAGSYGKMFHLMNVRCELSDAKFWPHN